MTRGIVDPLSKKVFLDMGAKQWWDQKKRLR